MDCILPGPLSMGFPRQEYWSGVPFSSPGDLPNPGIEPVSPALAGGFFTTEPLGKPHQQNRGHNNSISLTGCYKKLGVQQVLTMLIRISLCINF